MTEEQARTEVVRYWMGQAREALASAQAELAAGRRHFAVNRVYYACFYSASAVLLRRGRTYVRHSALRAAVHRELVKTGRLDAAWADSMTLRTAGAGKPTTRNSSRLIRCRWRRWSGRRRGL